MSDKQRILKSIATVAKQLGHTPSILEFAAHAEISRYSLFRLFPRWNDAVRAAGLKPNRLYVRPEATELLKDWGEVVRKKRAIPSRWAYRLTGKYYPLTLAKRFGGWESVPQAFRSFAKGKREWADVLSFLAGSIPDEKCVPITPPKGASQLGLRNDGRVCTSSQVCPYKALTHRVTYGNPMDFRGLRHEPVNEQGVVLLFGMLAEKLGYMVETVQNGFPDCEAKRRIGPERWQRVQIEFEYESKNFREHGHPMNGCDVIVCWRHNWVECPIHIEVVELSEVIRSLGGAEA